MTEPGPSRPLVQVSGLSKDFSQPGIGLRALRGGRGANRVRAVDGFELELAAGEAVAIVGESGSGKTTVARCVLHLLKPSAGTIRFDGVEVTTLSGHELRAFRRQAQIVFQDPFSSLDPRFTVQRALAEPLVVHGICTRAEIPERAAGLLAQVGLNSDFRSRYRHELSGGEAQRVSIARALATEPRFLVLDEPTSALDASARLRVISLLRELRTQLEMTYLVISHDLNIVRYLCDRVLVMYLGRVVEHAPAAELFANPQHPYTEALLSATPVMRAGAQPSRIRLRAAVEATSASAGCSLAPRCRYALIECTERPQRLTQIAGSHAVACHRVSEGQIALEPPVTETCTA